MRASNGKWYVRFVVDGARMVNPVEVSAEVLRALRVFPEPGVFELAAQRAEAAAFRVEVKDTSAAPPTGSAGR